MNKLEQLHLDAITQADYDPEDKVPNYVGFASKSAEITEGIAIEFAKFCFNKAKDLDIHTVYHRIEPTFQEFLKTKQ